MVVDTRDFIPERKQAVLIYPLGTEGQCIFYAMPLGTPATVFTPTMGTREKDNGQGKPPIAPPEYNSSMSPLETSYAES